MPSANVAGLANVHDVLIYMGRGLGSGVNRAFSRISSFRRAFTLAVPSNWMASRVKLTTGNCV